MVKPNLIALLSRAVSTPADGWTEHLCLQRVDRHSIELSIRAREVLAHVSELDGDVIWPEGYDFDGREEVDDDEVLPLSIDGKRVWGRDGEILLGSDLVPINDTATARFAAGEVDAAQEWLGQSDWRRTQGFDAAWREIVDAIAILSR